MHMPLYCIMTILYRACEGAVARALSRAFVQCSCPVRLHITRAHPMGGSIKIWGKNNTHEFCTQLTTTMVYSGALSEGNGQQV